MLPRAAAGLSAAWLGDGVVLHRGCLAQWSGDVEVFLLLLLLPICTPSVNLYKYTRYDRLRLSICINHGRLHRIYWVTVCKRVSPDIAMPWCVIISIDLCIVFFCILPLNVKDFTVGAAKWKAINVFPRIYPISWCSNKYWLCKLSWDIHYLLLHWGRW